MNYTQEAVLPPHAAVDPSVPGDETYALLQQTAEKNEQLRQQNEELAAEL